MKKKYSILTIGFILVFFLLPVFKNTSKAADFSIEISDTNLTSNVAVLPVYGSTGELNNNQKVCFYFKITGAPINIYSVLAGENYAISEERPDFNISYNNQKELLLVVSPKSIKSNYKGKLFDLQINFLPILDFYYNSVYSEILFDFITINNDTINIPKEKSTIKITPIGASQNYYESVSSPIPNPFDYEVDIYFSIEEETLFNITIFNSDGQFVQKIPGQKEDDLFKYWVQGASREFIELKENSKIPQGLYKLNLKPAKNVVSTGIYRIVFETEKKSYLINLSYVK